MRWKGLRRSSNVEDRRQAGGMRFPGLGGPRSAGVRRAGLGGGLGLVVLIGIALLLGVDPTVLLQGGGQASYAPYSYEGPVSPAEEELADMVASVLGSTEDTWQAVFSEQLSEGYQEPTLVMFSQQVRSACGVAGASVGPFYCPADGRIYIDLSFYRDLRERFSAPGDFAQAYVIAHEVGHHVQTLLGISQEVHAARGQVSDAAYNALSVQLELQADCLAGVWANHADRSQQILEAGDIEEALNAASAIGDDRIQQQTQGYVVPDSFTHGTSEQRVRWFRRGFAEGEVARCDTFNAEAL